MQCVCIEVEWQHSHSKHYAITSGFVFVASARKPAYSIGGEKLRLKVPFKVFYTPQRMFSNPELYGILVAKTLNLQINKSTLASLPTNYCDNVLVLL